MSDRQVFAETSVVVDGNTYLGQLMTVADTFLGVEDHGIFTSVLHLEGLGNGQGFGTYFLDTYDEEQKKRIGTAKGLDFIMQTIKLFGVESWEHIKGQSVIALRHDRYGTIVGLMHPIRNTVFLVTDVFGDDE